jgi:hypothetical protein
MIRMFIKDVFFKEYSADEVMSHPITDRHQAYFEDLYCLYGNAWEFSGMEKVVSYDDLADHLFDDQANKIICSQSDYLLFPAWGYGLNSSSAMPELRLQNKYSWTAPILDIKDCGSLCVFYAMHLMIELLKNEKIKTVSCCSIENKIIFTNSAIHCPAINYTGLFSIASDTISDLRLISCGIYPLCAQESVLSIIYQVMKNASVSPSQCKIFVKNTMADIQSGHCFHPISFPSSSGFFYFVLDRIKKNERFVQSSHVFIVDSDFDAMQCAIVHLYVGVDDVKSISHSF